MTPSNASTDTKKASKDFSHATSTSGLEIGDRFEVLAGRMVNGGFCLSHTRGKTIFLRDAVPGEQVLAQVYASKGKLLYAHTLQILEASEYRRDHIWAEASLERAPEERVGGAMLGYIDLAKQRELKTEMLRDALRRQGKLAPEQLNAVTVQPVADEEERGRAWRTRTRLHVDAVTGRVGQFAACSNRVIPVESLPLAVPQLHSLAPFDESMHGVKCIDLVAPSADDALMLIQHDDETSALGAEHPVREQVLDRTFLVEAGGFWQVHKQAAETLHSAVSAGISWLGDRVDPQAANFDLYGGVGLFADAFVRACGQRSKVTSIESAPGASALAAENLAEHAGGRAFCARVEDYLRDLGNANRALRSEIASGTVILDPPRVGAGGRVTQLLCELHPRNIIYVSCDPVAFARDLHTLQSAGYVILALRAFDLFPNTQHIETVVLLTKVQ